MYESDLNNQSVCILSTSFRQELKRLTNPITLIVKLIGSIAVRLIDVIGLMGLR